MKRQQHQEHMKTCVKNNPPFSMNGNTVERMMYLLQRVNLEAATLLLWDLAVTWWTFKVSEDVWVYLTHSTHPHLHLPHTCCLQWYCVCHVNLSRPMSHRKHVILNISLIIHNEEGILIKFTNFHLLFFTMGNIFKKHRISFDSRNSTWIKVIKLKPFLLVR